MKAEDSPLSRSVVAPEEHTVEDLLSGRIGRKRIGCPTGVDTIFRTDRTIYMSKSSTARMPPDAPLGEDADALVRRMVSGDQHAFAKLIGRYQADIFNLTWSRLGGYLPNQVKEIAQETYLRAWKSRETFDVRKGSFKDWLFMICKNECTDAWRRAHPGRDIPLDDLEVENSRAPETSRQLEKRQRLERTICAMNSLPRNELQVLVHSLDCGSYGEIASRMKLSVESVRAYLKRARRRLYEMVPEEFTHEQE